MSQEMFARKGFKVVPMLGGCSSAEMFGWFAKPVKSMDDFKGLKFRTAGIWGSILNEAGAAVVSMPGGEVYEALQRGVIDAFEYGTPGIDWAAGFQELGAYCTGPGIHAPSAQLDILVGTEEWAKLTPDLQAIVYNACKATYLTSWAYCDYQDVLGMQKLKDYGTKFVILSEDVQRQVVTLSNQYYDKLATEDEFFAKVLKSQRDFFKAHRQLKAFVEPNPALMNYES